MRNINLSFVWIVIIGGMIMSVEAQMSITSPAFSKGDHLPQRYTCDGANVSPPLVFNGISLSAESLVLIHDDPDAVSGKWTHWTLFMESIKK